MHHTAVLQQSCLHLCAQRYFLSPFRVEEHQCTVARRQQQSVLQHAKEVVACAVRVFQFHALFEVIATIDQEVLRPYQQYIVREVDKEVAPSLSCQLPADAWQEDMVCFVIHQYFCTRIDEHAPFRIHQQLTGVAVARLHRYTLKVVLLGISAYTVYSGHPEASLLVVEQSLHIVVGQSQRVLRTEILVILVSVVAVQSSERGNPKLPSGILFDGLHATVRQLLRHHQSVLLVLIFAPVALVLLLTGNDHHRAKNRSQSYC